MMSILRYLLLSLLLCNASAAAAQPTTGQRFVEAVNVADGAKLNALIHVDALAERVIEGMPADAPQRDDYLDQLRNAASSLGAQLATQLAAGSAVAKLVSPGADEPLVRISLSQGGRSAGHNYLRLRLHSDGRIADWYDYALAMWASDNLRFSAASLLSPADLALLLFRDREATQNATTMRLVAAFLAMADHAGAYQKLQSLPEEIRHHREYLTFAALLSRSVGMEEYRRNLASLARLHGTDPDLQFILIDHYMLEARFDQMLAAVAQLEGQVGTDEVVLNNRCAALLGLARHDEALAACDAVLAIDPDNDEALWTRVRLALTQQDAAKVVEALLRVEEATGQRMDLVQLSQREAYAAVRDAPEFQALLAQRAAQ